MNLHSNFNLQSKGRNVERSQLFFNIFHPVVALCFLVAVATLDSGEAFSGWVAVPSKASLLLAYLEHSLVKSSWVQECDSYLKILIVKGKYLLD